MTEVAIIGGGFAGLAAGVALAAEGVRVTVLEARQQLGGRAYSFADERTGSVVDNGQHAMMGCYTETLAFLQRIGAASKLVRQPNMHVEMAHPRLGTGTIRFASLPTPAHALVGILRYRLLSRAERLRALLGGMRLMALRKLCPERLAASTVEEVLVSLGQSEHARQSFWYPIAIATLNEKPDRAVAAPFAEVLARAFFASRAGSQFVLPGVGLSDLYTGDARRFIESRGGCVELGTAVESLIVKDGRLGAVRLRDGREVRADACISTVPPRALGRFLPEPLQGDPSLRAALQLESSPIVSVHLWWDRPILHGDFLGLLGTTTQWAFNRTRLLERSVAPGSQPGASARQEIAAPADLASGQAVSTVISAGRELVDWENERIADLTVADLRRLIPAARSARPTRSIVVKEKHATISLTPEAERARPPVATAIGNFFLAGDWIRTGLPATIESAVSSAHEAARLVRSLPFPA